MSMPAQRPQTANECANLVDLLRERAQVQPDTLACRYLGEDEEVRAELSYARFDEQARAIAARLQGLGVAGESAVLLYPPGLEFLAAFFGCLYAGVVAVPLPVPRVKASLTQFLGIVHDLNVRVVLTTETSMSRLTRLEIPELDTLMCLATETTPADTALAWQPPAVSGEGVAYLQYTSGSTANRKGVVIRHANVLANLRGIGERFRHHEASVCVNWLPHTHDLGLVSGMLQPILHGHPNVLMSPTAFVQQPVRWLNAITRYRGTYTNSPNFGYDACVRRTTEEQRAGLDLSSWLVALNGAEPVRWQTVDEFTALFAPCGFRREAMYPAYGLAEATLVVSGGLRDALPVAVNLDASALEQDRVVESRAASGVRTMVGCGHALQETEIAIVDPQTRQTRAAKEIGEIWVRGPGVAGGYWQRDDDTEATFLARRADDPLNTYLRTGDLGFLRDGELFITGRLKDLIIVRGANHYPQDIEWTVEQSHVAFRAGCSGAFSLPVDGTEQLVVVAELERDYLRTIEPREIWLTARRAVAEMHDLQLHTLVLLKTGTVPRTTSGKIQRRQCRADFISDALAAIWSSSLETADAVDAIEARPAAVASGEGAAEVTAESTITWLRDYAAECLNSRVMDERRTITPPVMLDFGNHGLLGLQVPREFGGRGFDYRQTMRVFEQLGAIDQTLAMMTIVHNVLGIRPIQHHGSVALRSEWLPRLASGRELVAFAVSEPGAGSNPQALSSTAMPDGADAWHLFGQKSWSGTAGWASVVNVFAQNLDADGQPRGVSGFAVPRGTKGMRLGPEALTLGMRGMVQNTIYLEGARVTRAQSLGQPGAGMGVAQDAMMHGRLAIAAACIGGMKRALQLLVRYAERRTIATGRLLDNPVLLERVVGLSGAVAALETLITRMAECLDRGEHVPIDAYIASKIAGSEWLWRAADDLVQFLGGRGYIETNVAAQLLRDARVTRILEGPTEALAMFLGSRVVNDGTDLRQFLTATLSAPRVSARLEEVASEIHARCTAGKSGFVGPVDARRWAYGLLGQIATDALLLAATPASAPPHHRAWAQQRFEDAIAAARSRADRGAFGLTSTELGSLVHGYAVSIGDIEQSLAGEDHELDRLLRRNDSRRAPPPPPTAASRAVEGLGASPIQPVAPTQSHRPPRDAKAIEQFIVRWVAKELKLPEASIDASRSFFDYGVDSVTTVMLGASLEEWLGMELNPELIYDIPVIDRFAAHLAAGQPQT
jgi:acyl-CoA synthetase (AMP-forming)/AMP-acid ligase II/alkylation response protein AidB-like acyl-CoA dehydrogenase/acyl carrier protein